jgi:hypothetical protein
MKERHTTKKTVILPLIVLMSSLLENQPIFVKTGSLEVQNSQWPVFDSLIR